MDDLVQWLRAQLDEDERTVKDQLCINCGIPVVPLKSSVGGYGYSHNGRSGPEVWQGVRCPGALTGAEPVQNMPRVLREIDAKRRLVDRMAEVLELGWDYYESNTVIDLATGTLRDIATGYSDRPGYREEWRP